MTATSKATRVNVCGVSEDKWENGWCKKCRCGCEMTHDVIVDARAYAYADKHLLMQNPASKSESNGNYKKYRGTDRYEKY